MLFFVFIFGYMLVKALYFQLSTGISSTTSIFFNSMLGMTVSILLMLTSFVLLITNKRRKLGMIILDVILTVILLSDLIYYRYYHSAISVPVLLQIGLVSSLGDSIKGLLKFWDILYIIDIPIFIAASIFMKRFFTIKARFVRKLIPSLAILLISSVACAVIYANIDKTMFKYDKNYVVKELGVLCFHAYDTGGYIQANVLADKSLTAEDKKAIQQLYSNKPKTTSKYKDIAKGKNLMIIQLEAIQAFFINRQINGMEITPNMNKLVKENVYFNNFFYQIGGGNTSDAEFMTNTSMYPVLDGAVYFRYPVNTYHSIAKMLTAQGYTANSFHGYEPSFWNRTNMHRNLGFDKFYSNKDFKIDQVRGWGLSDLSMFRQAVEKIAAFDKPSYSFLITLSSHFSYGSFSNYQFNVAPYDGTTLGNYIRAAHYVDYCIGELVSDLKARGLYDKTVLAIYGDHFGIPKYQGSDLRKFLNLDDSDADWMSVQKVPFILHCPGLPKGLVVETTGGQMDTLPTLANLMGFDSTYAMGKDLLNTKKGYAVLRNGSVATDTYYYFSDTDTAVRIKDKKELKKEDYQDEVLKFKEDLRTSEMILQKDAFKSYKLK